MSRTFQAIKVSDRVYWVGAIDWELRNFHGYLTSRGTTYNAYLILADEITLIDSVKAPMFDQMMSRIASLVAPSEIRNIISNHAEMDHSGCLPRLLQMIKPERVIASAQGEKALQQHFHWDQKVQVVKDNESMVLGNASLRFIETRMLHWPDSMFTYLEGDNLLFSNDAFGMHLAGTERFTDQIDQTILRYEAAKYYANILLPFSNLIAKVPGKLASADLKIDIIAPDHGPIWRRNPQQIVQWYIDWAAQKPSAKALVVYDTMWQSTARMAQAIVDGLSRDAIKVTLMPLGAFHRSDVATELLDAGALLIGSPTINGQLYPSVAEVVSYIKGLQPRNKIGAVFGSYGWNGLAISHLENHLKEMGVELVEEALRVRYVPDQQALAECRAFGSRIGEKLLASSRGDS
ncbi:MAG: flavodoxin domain-containing protein [Deltaproteobacteria bacterium]|nr:flavodoxin domain-containing protein [Deltaproteobacteria bacterium]